MTELDKDGLEATWGVISRAHHDQGLFDADRSTTAEAIRAYLDAADGWRPIETAPKDSYILTRIEWLTYPKVLFWASYANEWMCPASERGPMTDGWQPTHRHPLPTPPEE